MKQKDNSGTMGKWLVTITVMIPAFMEIVDTSIANVALPHMQGSLNAGTDEITWVLTSYLISNAVVLPMTGWLARMFGRRRFLVLCIALFTFSSFLCGSALSLSALVFFRIVQGAAGGALIPMSQAIMLESFPPEEAGMAMAIFGIGAMFGPVVGPTMGGWLTDNFTWRWIFYINIPVGIVAVLMTLSCITDPPYLKKNKEKVPVDYAGLLLLTVGIGSLQVVLDKGQRMDWFNSPFITLLTLLSVVSLAALLWVELKKEHPIINLRLFTRVSFSAGNFIMFMVGFCLYGSVVMLPLFLQTLMGYNATLAGLVMAPGGLATLIVMPFVGSYIKNHDGRKVILVGFVLGAYSMYLMRGFSLSGAYSDFVLPRIVLGIALGMIFPPLSTFTLAGLPREEMGNGTGIYNLLRNIGGSVGIAVSSTLLARLAQFYQTSLVSHVHPYNPVLQMRMEHLKEAAIAQGMDTVRASHTALAVIERLVSRQAGLLAYDYIFWVIGLAFLAVIPLLFLLKKQSVAAAVATEHH